MLLIQKALAEMIGTFAMIFVGVGSMMLSERYPQFFPPMTIPIAWGAIIALMIVAWGGTSGAHFNPAVTLVLTVTKRSSVDLLPMYWGSQFVGGLAAIALLEGIKKL